MSAVASHAPAWVKAVRWVLSGVIAVWVLYLGAEMMWYARLDFAALHEWGVSTGLMFKSYCLLAVIALGVIEVGVEMAMRRRDEERRHRW